MNRDHAEDFRRVLESVGLAPSEIVSDGELHRCPVSDKPTGKDGAYILHLDGIVSGWWQNWRTGESNTWTAEGQRGVSAQEKEALKKRIKRDIKTRQEVQAQVYSEKAAEAQNLINTLPMVDDFHPYLIAKGVVAFGDLRVSKDGKIVVPMLGMDGSVQSLQFIDGKGCKRFLTGGKVADAFFPIKGNDGQLYIVEGLATGLSVHEATKETVLCAFNAGNLKAVAESARKAYPKREIIIAGDNDLSLVAKGKENVGRIKAEAAAQVIGGKVTFPIFLNREDLSDFNDLHQLKGIEAVQEQLEQVYNAKGPKYGSQSDDFNFISGPDGVFFITEDKKGSVTRKRICSSLRVVACTRDEQGRNFGRLLEFDNREGEAKSYALPMELLAGVGDDWLSVLMNMGLEPESGNVAKTHLQSYIIKAPTEKNVLCVDRSGWCRGVFVLPSITLGTVQGEDIIYQGRVDQDLFKTSGTLQEWQEHIGKYCIGNSRFAFAVSIAFAGPLLALLGAESGGFHFMGNSSVGKTTLAEVAGSVCGGGGPHGFKRQWRTTDNALEGQALLHNDSLLILDEISQARSQVVADAAYMLANGQGKGRASRTGESKPASQWRLVFLSTGEISLEDYLMQGKHNVNAGQSVRMPSIPADAGKGMKTLEALHGFTDGAALSDYLKAASVKYYGVPLRSFIQTLTTDVKGAVDILHWRIESFMKNIPPQDADAQVMRVCKRFALVAAAGEAAISCGILPWSKGEAVNAARICFEAWVNQRGGIMPYELKEGLELISGFFQAHHTSRFLNLDMEGQYVNQQKIINCVGTKKRVGGEVHYRVYPVQFRKEIAQGKDLSLALDYLRKSRVLLCEYGRFTKSVKEEGNKSKRYVFTSAVLDLTFAGKVENMKKAPVSPRQVPTCANME